ncbi:sugar ABC transporter ATP-binding protein [Paenibacillus sp. MSJ-34]|uniref:sugar ABC transporter ATP-binding protein n=2 Tax=unclassified Paenibacillus TaxID=185978 RepID=UPI00345F796C
MTSFEKVGIAMSSTSILEIKNVSKTFSGVKALSDISFDVRKGEILGLIGENGAGKSTLIKILAGAHQKDSGEILLNGEPFEVRHPIEAQNLGLSVIYQEFNLIPSLSVVENIYLGKLPLKNGLVNWKKLKEDAIQVLEQLNLDINVMEKVSNLSVAKQQMVEISKALATKANVLIMDEPTATLTGEETEILLRQVRELKAKGITIIFVSHRLEELFSVCDRIAVLRDGTYVGTKDTCDLTKDSLIEMMVGRPLDQTFPEKEVKEFKEEVLAVKGLCRGKYVKNVSFTLHKGEILGVAGLVGAGRTELARLIFGADRPDAGEIFLRSKAVTFKSPHQAIKNGIGLVPEDRKNQGLVIELSVRENAMMANLGNAIVNGLVHPKKEIEITEKYIQELQIKTSNVNQIVKRLSGGNQQKVVLGKWMNADTDVLIFDEPTRGIDVGAKAEIYKLIISMAGQGKSIILISSELSEIIGLSDNVLVMYEGEITGTLSKHEVTQERIMYHATGGR